MHEIPSRFDGFFNYLSAISAVFDFAAGLPGRGVISTFFSLLYCFSQRLFSPVRDVPAAAARALPPAKP